MRSPFGGGENVLELDTGDGCTALSMYCHSRVLQSADFILRHLPPLENALEVGETTPC